MKCPSCGAEIETGTFCEFCGSRITSEMRHEQEQLNKQGCPMCGSTNIVFNREKQGEMAVKTGTAVIYSTVGLCRDCGYTWSDNENAFPRKKRKTWLWVLGWLFIFPIPLTILMLREKDMAPLLKYGIIAVAWAVFLFIRFGADTGTSHNITKNSAPATPAFSSETSNTQKDSPTETVIPPSAGGGTENVPEQRPAEETPSALKEDTPLSQKEALNSAKGYLDLSAFSHDGLVEQLEYEKFDHEEAIFAADNCGTDWYEQALKSATNYLSTSAFSYDGLIDQLEYEAFDHEEAVYAADNCGADWYEQALKSAISYLRTSAFSYDGLIDQLEYEAFSHEEAVYAADNCGADWNEQALKTALAYLEYTSFSREDLIAQLQYEGFTNDQVVYAIDKVGL